MAKREDCWDSVCEDCNGTGWSKEDNDRCVTCEGTGYSVDHEYEEKFYYE